MHSSTHFSVSKPWAACGCTTTGPSVNRNGLPNGFLWSAGLSSLSFLEHSLPWLVRGALSWTLKNHMPNLAGQRRGHVPITLTVSKYIAQYTACMASCTFVCKCLLESSRIFLIIQHSSYITYDTSAIFLATSMTYMYGPAPVFSCTILLAVPSDNTPERRTAQGREATNSGGVIDLPSLYVSFCTCVLYTGPLHTI